MRDGLLPIKRRPLRRASASAGLLFALLTPLHSACDREQDIEGIVDNAPAICRAFCQAEYDCEWGHDENLEDARSYLEERCVVNCTYLTERGALFIKRSLKCDNQLDVDGDCISYEEREEPAARVIGGVVQEYLECLRDAELFQCVDASFSVEIADEDACEQYSRCISLLDYPFFEGATWNGSTGVCEVPKQGDGDSWYYLDVLL